MSIKILLCGLLLTTVYSTVQAQRDDEEVLIESKTLSATLKSVRADTDNGNISVIGVDNGQTRVEVYARAYNNEKRVKERFAETYSVSLNTDNDALSISLKQKNRNRDSHISVSFRVYVPASVSSDLKSGGGNFHFKNLSGGNQEAYTKGGNIAFEGVDGNVSAKTAGGNIAISNCKKSIDVSTSGGNISANNSNGNLTLSTSGGNIGLDNLEGTIKATTSGGNVGGNKITGELHTSTSGGNMGLANLSCAVEASTGGGNLNVAMNKLDRYVKIRNSGSGHTHLDLPQDAAVDISATGNSVKLEQARGFDGDMSERKLKGKVGGGGLPVTIDGGGSRVVVRLR